MCKQRLGGEVDSTYRFEFPAGDSDFEAYIDNLEKEGLERLKAIEAERGKKITIETQKEIAELVRLQNKYLHYR